MTVPILFMEEQEDTCLKKCSILKKPARDTSIFIWMMCYAWQRVCCTWRMRVKIEYSISWRVFDRYTPPLNAMILMKFLTTNRWWIRDRDSFSRNSTEITDRSPLKITWTTINTSSYSSILVWMIRRNVMVIRLSVGFTLQRNKCATFCKWLCRIAQNIEFSVFWYKSRGVEWLKWCPLWRVLFVSWNRYATVYSTTLNKCK